MHMKKDINHPKNLFGLHSKAVTWEEATRENLLKRLIMAPIRLGFCASMMQLSYVIGAIIVPLWILKSWDFTRGSFIVYIYGIVAIILLLILLDEIDVLSKSFYRPRIFGNYGYTDVDVYFSSFSNSGVLCEHKNTSNDPIIKNISVDLLDYLYKEDIMIYL